MGSATKRIGHIGYRVIFIGPDDDRVTGDCHSRSDTIPVLSTLGGQFSRLRHVGPAARRFDKHIRCACAVRGFRAGHNCIAADGDCIESIPIGGGKFCGFSAAGPALSEPMKRSTAPPAASTAAMTFRCMATDKPVLRPEVDEESVASS